MRSLLLLLLFSLVSTSFTEENAITKVNFFCVYVIKMNFLPHLKHKYHQGKDYAYGQWTGWILNREEEDRKAEEEEDKVVASSSDDKFGPLISQLREFNRDILDHMKVVLTIVDIKWTRENQRKAAAKEAKGTVDKLYKSAGNVIRLFAEKDWSIEDDVVSYGCFHREHRGL